VYIDLWATWCIPCRAEFGYYKSLMPMMKQKNIQPVFISIDAPAAKSSWKKLVLMNNLEGSHILANRKLKADIEKLVYKKGQISVPRYLMINRRGQVVNWDAPRPSDAGLVKVINKL
ncbi:MAG: thioredoxin-like domain-containing protein, partial [Mucilaginibacter sp.]